MRGVTGGVAGGVAGGAAEPTLKTPPSRSSTCTLLSPAPTTRLLSCRSRPTGHMTQREAGRRLTLELRTMELISGISRLDLKEDRVSASPTGGGGGGGGSHL